ncbi:MAG: D-2-hydroxyacid dehydrogenase [Bacteroidia bacterium]|jgi:D-3-phosphoglycerate dehydrogenase|nr:D-2-hydroxyacid dehydrogenase [Bacteroidia bacterium]
MKKILANDGIDKIGKELLEKAGFVVDTEKISQDKLIDIINEKEYSVLIVRSATQVRKDIIDACPNLKIIARGGVGMDNIDVEYAKQKGIVVINTPAASSHSVAELVFAHLLSLVRKVHLSNREMPLSGNKEFNTLKKKYSDGIELKDKTIGIIGFGRIGQEVAKIAIGLQMNVLAYDPYVSSAELEILFPQVNKKLDVTITTTTLDDVLINSDFITLHVPGGDIISKKEIEKMKQGVFIINASRGGVVNENDLLEALNTGKVAGAGLDVFMNEPTPDSKLLSHSKVSVTPHIGASTKEAQQRIAVELSEKIIQAYSKLQIHS